jgi:hypothetical protein
VATIGMITTTTTNNDNASMIMGWVMDKKRLFMPYNIESKAFVVPLSRTLVFHFKPLYSALYYYERDRAAEILSVTPVRFSCCLVFVF